MQTSLICLIFVLNFCWCLSDTNVCVLPGAYSRQADYYWRDYFGIVPEDAVPGGFDEAGNVTYIGQLKYDTTKAILPGMIYPGRREVVGVAGNKRVSSSEYVKIFCSQIKPTEYEWRRVNVADLHLLIDFHFAIGGYEDGVKLFIGRANFEGQVQTGKVFPNHSKHRGLRLFTKRGGEIMFPTFELLVFPR